MSYEDKIRDLMARLVSMSPEPPDFPEEAPMASQPTRSRPRPALVFAAAVLAVALLAVPVILLTSGNTPPLGADSTTTSTVAPVGSTTTVPASTTTTLPATTTTTAAPIPCESSGYPTCGGSCPPGTQCQATFGWVDDGPQCKCVETFGATCDSPWCGPPGRCPPGSTSTASTPGATRPRAD